MAPNVNLFKLVYSCSPFLRRRPRVKNHAMPKDLEITLSSPCRWDSCWPTLPPLALANGCVRDLARRAMELGPRAETISSAIGGAVDCGLYGEDPKG